MRLKQFPKRKKLTLEGIDQRLSILQEHRGCVASANDYKDLEGCRKKRMGRMQSMRKERKTKLDAMKKLNTPAKKTKS